MTTTNKALLAVAIIAAIAGPAWAVFSQNRSVSVPTTVAAVPEGVTALTLSVTERLPVKQDMVIANVRYEIKGASAKEVQNKINTAVQQGLDAIKGDADVKISTESYQVYMNYHQIQVLRDGQPVVENAEEWRGSQAVTLESKDANKIKALTGKLQDLGFAVSNLQYTLSPEKSEEVRQTLMKGALDKIKTQADQATKLLGKKGYEIREVSVDGGYMPPMPMYAKAMRMEMAAGSAADMAAPNVEAGEQDVNMTLNARVELK